jgi:hypothetical protein
MHLAEQLPEIVLQRVLYSTLVILVVIFSKCSPSTAGSYFQRYCICGEKEKVLHLQSWGQLYERWINRYPADKLFIRVKIGLYEAWIALSNG